MQPAGVKDVWKLFDRQMWKTRWSWMRHEKVLYGSEVWGGKRDYKVGGLATWLFLPFFKQWLKLIGLKYLCPWARGHWFEVQPQRNSHMYMEYMYILNKPLNTPSSRSAGWWLICAMSCDEQDGVGKEMIYYIPVLVQWPIKNYCNMTVVDMRGKAFQCFAWPTILARTLIQFRHSVKCTKYKKLSKGRQPGDMWLDWLSEGAIGLPHSHWPNILSKSPLSLLISAG